MTQTSSPAGGLSTLLSKSYDLAAALGAGLDEIKNREGTSEAWCDLKIAFDAANLAAAQLYQVIKRKRAADEPVPYLVPDDLDLPF